MRGGTETTQPNKNLDTRGKKGGKLGDTNPETKQNKDMQKNPNPQTECLPSQEEQSRRAVKKWLASLWSC